MKSIKELSKEFLDAQREEIKAWMQDHTSIEGAIRAIDLADETNKKFNAFVEALTRSIV